MPPRRRNIASAAWYRSNLSVAGVCQGLESGILQREGEIPESSARVRSRHPRGPSRAVRGETSPARPSCRCLPGRADRGNRQHGDERGWRVGTHDRGLRGGVCSRRRRSAASCFPRSPDGGPGTSVHDAGPAYEGRLSAGTGASSDGRRDGTLQTDVRCDLANSPQSKKSIRTRLLHHEGTRLRGETGTRKLRTARMPAESAPEPRRSTRD